MGNLGYYKTRNQATYCSIVSVVENVLGSVHLEDQVMTV